MYFISDDDGSFKKEKVYDEDLDILDYYGNHNNISTQRFIDIVTSFYKQQLLLAQIAMRFDIRLQVSRTTSIDKWIKYFYNNVSRNIINYLDSRYSKLKQEEHYLSGNSLAKDKLVVEATEIITRFLSEFTNFKVSISDIDKSCLANWEFMQSWSQDVLDIANLGIIEFSFADRTKKIIPHIEHMIKGFIKNIFPKSEDKGWEIMESISNQSKDCEEQMLSLLEQRNLLSSYHYDNKRRRIKQIVKQIENVLNSYKKQFSEFSVGGYENLIMYQVDTGGIFNSAKLGALLKNLPQATLVDACKNGNMLRAEKLLSLGLMVDVPDSLGRYPIHFGVISNYNSNILNLLLSRPEFNINQCGLLGHTPAHSAVLFNNCNGLTWLIDNGVDINATDEFGKTPLHYAAYCGHLDMLNILLQNPNVEKMPANEVGATPLAEAIMSKLILPDHDKLFCVLVAFSRNNCHLSDKDWELISDKKNELQLNYEESYRENIEPFLKEEATIVQINQPRETSSIYKSISNLSLNIEMRQNKNKNCSIFEVMFNLINIYKKNSFGLFSESFFKKATSMANLILVVDRFVNKCGGVSNALKKNINTKTLMSALWNSVKETDDSELVCAVFLGWNPEVNKLSNKKNYHALGHKVIVKAIAFKIFCSNPDEARLFAKEKIARTSVSDKFFKNNNSDEKADSVGCFSQTLKTWYDLPKISKDKLKNISGFSSSWTVIKASNFLPEFNNKTFIRHKSALAKIQNDLMPESKQQVYDKKSKKTISFMKTLMEELDCIIYMNALSVKEKECQEGSPIQKVKRQISLVRGSNQIINNSLLPDKSLVSKSCPDVNKIILQNKHISSISFINNAQKYGLICKNVPGDGNCFFHAVFAQLPEDIRNQYGAANDIREATSNHIAEHIESYRDFIPAANKIDINNFVNGLYDNEEWANHLLILATSRILGVTIAIVRSDNAEPVVIRQRNDHLAGHQVLLGYEVGVHYQILRYSEQPMDASLDINDIINTKEYDDFDSQNNTETKINSPGRLM